VAYDKLLEVIEGRTAEDLTTSVLAFLLASKKYRPLQKIVYEYILGDNLLKDTFQRQLNVQDQVTIENLGRPDLVITGNEIQIIIENKFYAEFSQGDQLVRYSQALDSERTNILALITIHDRLDYYKRLTDDMFKKVKTEATIKYLTWERLLELIDCDDILVNSLSNYIHSKYIISTNIGEEGLSLMNSESIPTILDSIWGAVDKLKDYLYSIGVETKRISQSRFFYGFSVTYSWGELFTGFSHLVWKNHSTPFYVQLRLDWLELEIEGLSRKLKGMGYIYDDELEWIYPVKIESENIESDLMQKVKDILEKTDGTMMPI